MTLLAADIGNSHTVARACSTTARSSPTGGSSTDERRTADEWAVLLAGLLGGARLDGVSGDRRLRDRAGGAARVARHAGAPLRRRCRTSSSSRACAPACPC